MNNATSAIPNVRAVESSPTDQCLHGLHTVVENLEAAVEQLSKRLVPVSMSGSNGESAPKADAMPAVSPVEHQVIAMTTRVERASKRIDALMELLRI